MSPARALLRTAAVLAACLCLVGPDAPRAAETVLVAAGSPMKHRANGTDPGLGLSWVSPAFNDAAWSAGIYGVGYDLDGSALRLIRTPVPAGSSSVYTRALFTVADPAAVENLFLGADHDDGFAAWINGVLVYRSPGMPGGDPAWNTRPASHESSNGLTPVYDPLVDVTQAALPALRPGQNVLAIGVWNTTSTSSDLVLVPRLSMNRPAGLTRGPYLQSGTPGSVVIRWRTSLPTDTRVLYGPEPGLLTSSLEDPAAVTEHVVTLTGLAPDTRYYYAVGTTRAVLAGDDTDHFFVTSPVPGSRRPFRVWALGDSGTADASARAVRDAWEAFSAGGRRADFWLMLGDNAYPDGTDAQYQAAVFDTYPAMLAGAVLWPTLGNHDGHTADSASQSGPYYDIFTLPAAGEAGGQPSGTEAYYSFDYGDAHFICLESYETDRSASGAMMTWLKEDLASTSATWVIAFWHHPPYSRGSHDSDSEIELVEMRRNALPILEEGGVDLVLSGHSHSYERSFLLDGHYGPSSSLTATMKKDGGDGREEGSGAYRKPPLIAAPHEGAVYVVAGSSGQTSGGRLNHPAMYLSLDTLGSLVIDVDDRRLDATFLDAAGRPADHFTIVKRTAHPPVARASSAPRVECASSAGATVSLDGTASTDEDSSAGTNDDIVEYRWYEDAGLPGERLLGTGERLDVTLPLGAHDITLVVIDSGGDTGAARAAVLVEDTTPPGLSASVEPSILWPPDGRMSPVTATISAVDLCGPSRAWLEAVEVGGAEGAPEPRGGPRSGPEVRGAEPGTPDLDFELRAERAGGGAARIYVITYASEDAAGNVARVSARVIVPHDLRPRTRP